MASWPEFEVNFNRRIMARQGRDAVSIPIVLQRDMQHLDVALATILLTNQTITFNSAVSFLAGYPS